MWIVGPVTADTGSVRTSVQLARNMAIDTGDIQVGAEQKEVC